MEKGKKGHWVIESKDQNPIVGSAIIFVNLELASCFFWTPVFPIYIKVELD